MKIPRPRSGWCVAVITKKRVLFAQGRTCVGVDMHVMGDRREAEAMAAAFAWEMREEIEELGWRVRALRVRAREERAG